MKLSTENELEVISMKNNSIPNIEIIDKFNISLSTIYNIVKRNGKEKKTPNKKYHVDDTFFENINNEEKAYWLGFLYADGYVRMHKKRSGELRLKLKIDDKSHIENFKNSLKSTHIIKDFVSKVKINDKVYESLCSSLSVYSTKMVKDLFDLGCTNNKTHTIQFPYQIGKRFYRDFIRGYFDGDGCIHKVKNKNSAYFKITSGSKEILHDIKCIMFGYNLRLREVNKKWYDLICTNKDDLQTIYHYLYDNSKLFLERKYNHYKKIIETICQV